jgi:hypothetical protein
MGLGIKGSDKGTYIIQIPQQSRVFVQDFLLERGQRFFVT